MEKLMSKTPSKRSNVRKNGGKLRDTIDPVEDAKAREKILQSRVALVLNHGFFGNLAMRLKLENGDSWLTTAATDGRKFYYNCEFINKLTVGEIRHCGKHALELILAVKKLVG